MEDTMLKDLEDRLGNVIKYTCNNIGCKNCDLKYSSKDDGDCSATDLQSKIFDIKFKNK